MANNTDSSAGAGSRLTPKTRLAAGVSCAVIGLVLIGMAYQGVAEKRQLRQFHPPGVLVQVEDVRLHLYETGGHHLGPTVILDSGRGGFSAQWGWVQPAVADFARVVSYDRPGLGWSGRAPEQLDETRIAEYLYAALRAQGIAGPFIHVSHTISSPIGRALARRYPGEVVGMVKVDVSVGVNVPLSSGEMSHF